MQRFFPRSTVQTYGAGCGTRTRIRNRQKPLFITAYANSELMTWRPIGDLLPAGAKNPTLTDAAIPGTGHSLGYQRFEPSCFASPGIASVGNEGLCGSHPEAANAWQEACHA